jgi:LPXTG-motif cell wall-anchored protein
MACVTLNVVTPTVPTPIIPTAPTQIQIPTWVWIVAGVAVAGGIGYMLVKKRR